MCAQVQNSAPSSNFRSSIIATGSKFEKIQDAEDIEIAAQITVPHDGGWAWVVLLAASSSLFIVDGHIFSYGALLREVANDLSVKIYLSALISSCQRTFYYLTSPLASAVINKYGFRVCGMFGSIICTFSAIVASVSENYASFFIFYSIILGSGASFISMASNLVVGFYFERYRTVAMTIVTSGTSLGLMVIFPITLLLVDIGGWHPTVLAQSGSYGIIYFLSMTYRPLPLLSVKVTKTEETGQETQQVTVIPKRAIEAKSNVLFPTVAEVVQEETSRSPETGTSTTSAPSRIILQSTQAISNAQFNQVKSIMSRGKTQSQPTVDRLSTDATSTIILQPTQGTNQSELNQVTLKTSRRNTAVNVEIEMREPRQKKTCWLLRLLCHWEPHSADMRPLYRDDAFYDGNLKTLPAYQKSMANTGEATGFEYQLAVTRVVSVHDLKENRGMMSSAVKRVFATMLDVKMLKRSSFKILCISGVLIFIGSTTPVVFLRDKNLHNGVDPNHCKYFVSVVGLFTTLGRIFWSIVATKVSPSKLYVFGTICAGVSTILSSLSYTIAYQYAYSAIFGMFVCTIPALRSSMMVEFYGLENLTSATGMYLMFLSLGTFVGPPLAGILKDLIGYDQAFYFSGSCMTLGGMLAIPVLSLTRKERQVLQNANKATQQ